MIQAEIKGMTKSFGKFTALDNFTLRINNGELLTLLGPSGCGKTTMLNIIAGLERPDKGSISISGNTVCSVENNTFISPDKRMVAMVFQNYALWPHYNVYQNIAYPLKIMKAKKGIADQEVKKALSFVKLGGKGERYPHQLSGGEQQRVALARALVMKPKLVLLDEPLSNLDAYLKEKMIHDIKELQRKAGLTIVYVTHDQHEAMGIADRMGVMNKGKLIQIGTPKEIYENPKTAFVARFIGSTNIINAKKRVLNGQKVLEIAYGVFVEDSYSGEENIKESIVLSIRPEDIILDNEKGIAKGEIINIIYKGNEINYEISVSNRIFQVLTPSWQNYVVGEKVSFSFRRATVINYDE